MPANLTPEYREAEQQLRQAGTPEEKLTALRRMLSTIPKHKGTEKLQADLKRRIARLRTEIQSQTRKKGYAVQVEREGVAQVVLVGSPNAGKSQLAAALTGVSLEVAPYPYSTQRPVPAMMPYEDILIQLVDLPPVSPVHTEAWLPNIVRTADAALIVADLSSPDVPDQIADCLSTLEEKKVRLVGGESDATPWASVAEKKARLVGTKLDLPHAEERWKALIDLYGKKFESSIVSGQSGTNLEGLREDIFRMLRLVRIYSKPPGREADRSRPFVLGEESTLLDFAKTVHHDFEERLKFARVWGHEKFEGQRINKDYRVRDGDVIELHLG